MAQNIGRLGVVLALETAEFVKGLGQATIELSKFVDKAKPAIMGATGAMTALIAKTVAYADDVSDLADANDVAISSVMALGSALAVSGGKADNAGKLLSSFTSKIDSAAQGNEGAQKSFERLGISLKDIANMTNEQLLDKVVKKLSEIADPVTRNALAMEMFSKAGKNINWKQMEEAIEANRKKYKEYEEGIRAAGDAADMVAMIFKTKLGETAKAVGEDLKTTLEYMSELSGKTSVVGEVMSKVFETIVVLGSDVVFVFKQIILAVDTLSNTSFTSLQKNIDQWKEYNAQARKSREELDAFQKKILENKKSEGVKDNPKDDPAVKRLVEMDAKNKEMLRVAKLLSDEYKRQQATQLQQLAIRGLMAGMTSDERREQEAVNQVIDSTSKKIDEITKKREDAAGRGGSAQVIAEYDAQIAKIYELQEVYIEMARNIEKYSIESERTFAFGWNKAFKQFAEDAYNYGKLAESMFNSLVGNMNSAIDEFVEKGTFSFSKFAESVIKDIIKIQLRMQAAQLFSMGINSLMGAFGGGATATGGAYGSMGGTAGLGGSMGTGLKFAEGGNPPVGVPSLVGERGPELFIPSRAGTIIPNNQLSNALQGLGGGGTTINGPYIASMNAIDTQSGVQFLAKNKMTIWSMNQSANRSIPAGR